MYIPKQGEEENLHLAVLIDADNAQASVIEALLAEVARYGEATVKRIYGDFTSKYSSQWKSVLNKFANKTSELIFPILAAEQRGITEKFHYVTVRY